MPHRKEEGKKSKPSRDMDFKGESLFYLEEANYVYWDALNLYKQDLQAEIDLAQD